MEVSIFIGIIIVLCVAYSIDKYNQNKNKKATNDKNEKYIKSNNCNGCSRQETCRYGYYTYDVIDKRQWSLWEKFMMLAMSGDNSNIETDFTDRPEEIEIYINRYSKQTKFDIEDIEWLEKYLDYEQRQLNQYIDFGKCGKAYVRYMKLDYLVKELKEKLKKIKHNETLT